MRSHISPAIIMRTKDYGESDVLVSFFTCDKGRLKGVAKGARRSRRRFVNCLDPFSLVNLEYDPMRKGDLHFLHSGKLLEGFAGLRRGFISFSLASYMVELTEILFPLGVVDSGMFDLLKGAFKRLDGGEDPGSLRVLVEARAMSLGGYGIGLKRCCKCGRPYLGQGRAVFVAEEGGIACLKCARETALRPGLDPLAVKELDGLQSDPPIGIGLSLTGGVIDSLRAVLKLHILHRLGRELRTGAYLE